MACSCNRKAVPPSGSSAARAAADKAQAAAQARQAARAANPATSRIGSKSTGETQSFTLRVGDKTAVFGSALERDAAAVRLNGK